MGWPMEEQKMRRGHISNSLLPATYKPKRKFDQSELKGKSAIIDFNYFKTSKNDRKPKRQKFSR